MAVPTFEKFLYPFLSSLKDKDSNRRQMVEEMRSYFNLSDEDMNIRTKSGSISQVVEVISYIHSNGKGFIVVDMIDNNENLQDILFNEYGIMIGRIKKDNKIYLRFSFNDSTQKNEIHILIEALKDIARNHKVQEELWGF